MKKILCIILIGTMAICSTSCGKLNTSQGVEKSSTQETQKLENQTDDKKAEDENLQNQQNKDFSEYEKYIDRARSCGLIYSEFSKGNYLGEYPILLALIEEDELPSFSSSYSGKQWEYYQAKDVEENIMSKLDISVEEIREKAGYIKEIDAYPDVGGLGGVCSDTIIKDVNEKDNTFKIYYQFSEEKLSYEGILTVSKEGKIISNSGIKHY